MIHESLEKEVQYKLQLDRDPSRRDFLKVLVTPHMTFPNPDGARRCEVRSAKGYTGDIGPPLHAACRNKGCACGTI